MIYLVTMEYVFAVWSLIVLIVKCNAGNLSGTGIDDDMSSSGKPTEQAVYFKAEINKPLEMNFQNIMFIVNGWCEDFYDKTRILRISVSYSKIYIQNVTYRMSTVWRCELITTNTEDFDRKKPLQHRYSILFITLHVKGAKSVEMTVNDKEVTFSEADLAVPYDGNTDYWYEDGQIVYIVCQNPHSTGTVRLEYFANDTKTVLKSATFDIQLYPGDNHTFIECAYMPAGYDDKYVYRVTFVTKKPSVHSKEIKTLSDAKISSSILFGSSLGAVFVLLAVTGMAYYCVKMRNAGDIETSYEALTIKNENSTSQMNEYENRYDACYETPRSAEDMAREENYYTKIDYARCQPTDCDRKTRKSLVYDEPYVHIDVKNITYVNIASNPFLDNQLKLQNIK